MTTAEVAPGAAPRVTLLDRAIAVYPLAVAYVVLFTLYAWQATRHSTPWLFTDELEWAKKSLGVARTGHAQLRLHDTPVHSLYAYLIAPSWWLGSTGRAYAAAKYINAAAMTATLFPAYGLARLFLGRRAALVAAVASTVIPAFVYTGLLIPEPLAYVWSTLVLWLIARALLRPTGWSITLASSSAVAASYIRGELAVLPAAGLLALLLVVATGRRGRALLSSWSIGDRAGAATLMLGVLIAAGAFAGHHSYSWYVGWHFHDRVFTYGLWAIGAFTIGVGVIPVAAALAWLLGARWRTPDERALAAVLTGCVVVFGLYTAVKASYLSTTFAVRVEERNFIYVAPLVFVAAVRYALHGRFRIVSAVLSVGAIWYLLETTPYHNNEDFYSDAPGLTILQWLNQNPRYWTTADARHLLLGMLAGAVVVAGAREAIRRRGIDGSSRTAFGAAALLAVLMIGWSLTNEVFAANASNRFSKSYVALPSPPNWIDRATGRARTMFLGVGLAGSGTFWSIEFWNQSIDDVWSTDGSAPGPGPVLTPDYASTDGEVTTQYPINWAVVSGPVTVVGRLQEEAGGLRLMRLSHPIKIASAVNGITPDGWLSSTASFEAFAPNGPRAGTLVVSLTRGSGCNALPPPTVTFRVYRMALNSSHQPVPGRLVAVRRTVVRTRPPCPTAIVRVPVSTPFIVTATSNRTFQPSKYDPRQLTAQVGFSFR